MIVLSKSPDPLDWTQHLSTIGLTPYLPAEVSTFMISAHQRCFATNKMWCLSPASLCLHARGLLLIRSSSDLYRSSSGWTITFREFLFITFDLSSSGRCHQFSDFSAQSSCRDSSEGLHVCGYNDRLLFVFLFYTFIGKKRILLSFVIFALWPNGWELSTCFPGHGPFSLFPCKHQHINRRPNQQLKE